jgi:chemotaxis protein CheD
MGVQYFVGMAELRLGSAPDTLTIVGLGSCVAITLYDRKQKIGAMAHAMLPTSHAGERTPRFADTAVELLLEEFSKKGILPSQLTAKLAGGADMFPTLAKDASQNIGLRNAEVAKEALKKYGIRVTGEDLGGDHGRSIHFHLEDGLLVVQKKI